MLRQLKIKLVLTLAALALTAGLAAAQTPQVTLRSTDGSTFNLADHRGKVVVLSFGATWVPLANKELPALQKLADRYAGRGAALYWVSTNSTKPGAKTYISDAELESFARQNGLRLPVLRDPDQTAYRALGLNALPTLVIIDRDGHVHRKQVGFDPEQAEPYGEVVRILDQLLK